MKRYPIYHIILISFLSLTGLKAQISPGDLSQAHADLEGMSNCTLCHDLGKKVSNAKCLDCHKEIKSLINQKSGYHASKEVSGKDCFECHSDHHGRKFDMVRFDEDNFNHNLTGYKLEGQHEVIDCRKCHVPDNIHDRDLKKRKDTFLGMDDKCLSCHDDYHQKTMSDDCAKCHNIEAFRPAPKFDHDEAKFKLVGKHKEVDCKECHEMTTKNGKEFQLFTGIEFADCVACHEDPHSDKFDSKCSSCHTESAFSTFIGKRNFNHNTTDFTLKGKHKSTDCFSCHDRNRDAKTIFQDKKGINENQCIKCHEDFHKGKFGNDCAKCHQESSFTSMKTMDFFDNNLTDYHLEGNHVGVDCKNCHKKNYSDPIDFSACKNCHEDYHKGEFLKNGTAPDCVECHSLIEGFEFSLYTTEQHQTNAFPLDGGHLATPCFSCHFSEDRWTFRNIGTECIDCHNNIHEGFMEAKFLPDNKCESCHITASWATVDFDHNRTSWPLEGKHSNVSCGECHFKEVPGKEEKNQVFKDLDQECFKCHENIHEQQFEENGITDCKRCHDSADWFPRQFDHDKTEFPLEGKHAEVECKECHKPSIVDGKSFVDYKIEKFECIDCHQ